MPRQQAGRLSTDSGWNLTAGLLRGILPPMVAVEETFGTPYDVRLFPEERSAIAGAVEKRRREFVGARFCARSALEQLGLPAAPILPGPGGAPLWPEGVVGSITHCDGYCASAVASARGVLAVGIDAEPAAPPARRHPRVRGPA
jgi:4'-phosphopantetheinyl transferase EntD